MCLKRERRERERGRSIELTTVSAAHVDVFARFAHEQMNSPTLATRRLPLVWPLKQQPERTGRAVHSIMQLEMYCATALDGERGRERRECIFLTYKPSKG